MHTVNYESHISNAIENLTSIIEFVKLNSNNIAAHKIEEVIHKKTLEIGKSLMMFIFKILKIMM